MRLSILFLFIIIKNCIVFGQYSGNNGDGIGSSTSNMLHPLPAIYGGNNGDGVSSALSTLLHPLPAIYGGNNGDGVSTALSILLNRLPAIYGGNNGDGVSTALSVLLNPLPAIYGGNNGDGYGSITHSFQNSNCADDLFFWTGKVDHLWNNPSNWDCSNLPGEKDSVVIKQNVDNFPTANIDVNIGHLLLQIGSMISLESGFIFKIIP